VNSQPQLLQIIVFDIKALPFVLIAFGGGALGFTYLVMAFGGVAFRFRPLV